jgi:hypothetical protein
MTAIQVDTQFLRQVATQLEDLAGRMRVASNEVLDATQGAPTIEGQFGPEVRALGMELFAKFEDRHQQLSTMALELADFADRFDAVDQASLPELQTVFLQWLTGFGVYLPELVGTDAPAGLAAPTIEGPPPPPEEDEDKGWIDYLLDQFDLDLAWQTITDKWVAGWMSRARGLPRFTVALPWIKGFGPSLPADIVKLRSMLGLTDDLAGPLLRQMDSGYAVRAVGRLIGDASGPPLLMIGWGLTLAPEQIRDISSHAPLEERLADAAVDSGNFLLGEGVGWFVGIASSSLTGPGGVAAKLGSDVGVGFVYDILADQLDWREKLAVEIGQVPEETLRGLAETTQRMFEQEANRVPTPDFPVVASATPSPQSGPSGDDLLATPTPGIAPNPTPEEDSPRPSPTATPSP